MKNGSQTKKGEIQKIIIKIIKFFLLSEFLINFFTCDY